MCTEPEPLERAVVVYRRVPRHPALCLLSSDARRYPATLLERLVAHIADSLESEPDVTPAITAERLKALLRRMDQPEELAAVLGLPAWRGNEIVRWCETAVATLERPAVEQAVDRRGSILRMRYIERRSAKTIRHTLHLSERHYYRLQAAGLAWLAAQLQRYLSR